MAEAAQQHLGQGSCQLSIGGGENFSALDEVKIEAAHLAEREEMIVPLLRRGGGDGDFLRPRTSAGDERARPSQCFERLVPRAGARFCVNFRVFPWRLHNRNAELVNPGRHGAGAGDPSHLGLGRERCEKRSPDR